MSLRAWLIRNTAIRLFGWGASYKRGLAKQRRFMDWAGLVMPLPRSASKTELTCHGVPCELIQAGGVNDDAPILIYYHGGGYCIGSPVTYRDFAAQISRALSCRVLMPDYRLAPENPYPAPMDDCFKVWQWVLEQGQAPNKTILAGDSAGGGLVAAMLQRIQMKGETMPAKAWFISPWVDHHMQGETYVTHKKRDKELSPETLGVWRDSFVPADKVASFPELNCCSEDISGWPPICIQVGTEEVLLDDSRMLKANAEKHHLHCDYSEWQGMWHVFQPYTKFAPEARQAFDEAMAFLKP